MKMLAGRLIAAPWGAIVLMMVGATGPIQGQARDHRGHAWSMSGGVGWTALNGARRLVRGDRKVVTTDASGGWTPFIEAGVGLGDRYTLSFRVSTLHARYTHNEAFTNGMELETSDDLPIRMFTGGVGRLWTPGHGATVTVGMHIAYLAYGDTLYLVSERIVPEDLSTINPGRLDLRVVNAFGLGGGAQLSVPLGGTGVRLALNARLTVAFMPANIIDDPEDPEPHVDVNSPMHPIDVGLALVYAFGGGG